METVRQIILILLWAGSCFAQVVPEETIGSFALGVALKGASSGTQNDDNQSTGSYAITSPSLLVAYVVNSKASNPDQPTASGNGLTWTALFTTNYASDHRLTVFTAKNLFGGTAGAFTATTSGVNQTGWAVGVVEVTDPAMSGGTGTNSIRTRVSYSTNGTIFPVNFGTLGSRTLCVVGLGGSLNGTAASSSLDWTKVVAESYSSPTTELGVWYQLRGSDSSCDITNSSSTMVGHGIEFYQRGARD